MRRSVCTLRKAAMIVVAVLSVVFALFLVWHLVTPGRISHIDNSGLVAVLALLIVPAATAAAWELDRRAAQRASAREPQPREPAGRTGGGARVHGPHAPGTAARHTGRRPVAPTRVK
jgi:hypothetical protein